MGRIRDAWHALTQRERDPYLRWSDIPRIQVQLAEQEEALASLFDKLNTVMARWRKREQRERETEQVPPDLAGKAGLRRRAAQLRFPDLAIRFETPHNGHGHDVGSDQSRESD